MSKKNEPNTAVPESTPQWADLWQSFSESSKEIGEAWSSSMAPFMLARLLEHPAGFSVGNEMSAAIEKMAQGPQLADVWDIDRKWRWCSARGWKCDKSWRAITPSQRRRGRKLRKDSSEQCPLRPPGTANRLQTGAKRSQSGVKSPTKS
jgi:hypothetical protein